ncbi:MAG TPA: hypothetical protein VG474_01955, partial [Solirubrobacteraceae bacterium]|nr:hypothetical protein [Solirubrobacteraceae bacterium]
VLAGAALNSVLSGSEEGKRDAARALAELRARNERLTRTLKRIRRGSARDERRLRILRRQLQPIRAAR